MLQKMQGFNRSSLLCNIAAMNDNVECFKIAQNAGFNSIFSLSAIIKNKCIAFFEYAASQELLPGVDQLLGHHRNNMTTEMFVILHKHGYEITHGYVISLFKMFESCEEYSNFLEEFGITFTSNDYNHINPLDFVKIHKDFKVPFPRTILQRIYSSPLERSDLEYINEHGGIEWCSVKMLSKNFHGKTLSKSFVEYAAERGINFNKAKVEDGHE